MQASARTAKTFNLGSLTDGFEHYHPGCVDVSMIQITGARG
jgi:hypothetical protein